MPRTAFPILLGLLLTPTLAWAKYIPIPLCDMLGSSDLIVVGTITEVNEASFVLAIDKLVVGEFNDPIIEVAKFRDWTCAARWTPYAADQQVLLCLFRATDVEGNPKWSIRSGGGEGEMPIADDEVYCRGRGLPADADHHTLDGAHVFANRVPLPLLMRTIRAYRRCYVWDVDRSTPSPRVTGVRCVADDEALAEFKASGPLAAYLAEAAEGSSCFKP